MYRVSLLATLVGGWGSDTVKWLNGSVSMKVPPPGNPGPGEVRKGSGDQRMANEVTKVLSISNYVQADWLILWLCLGESQS